jgi:hypothetical protein
VSEDPKFAAEIERLCEVMHDAYERAAAGLGWETQTASRKPWADVPEANKATMRAAVRALHAEIFKDTEGSGMTACICPIDPDDPDGPGSVGDLSTCPVHGWAVDNY